MKRFLTAVAVAGFSFGMLAGCNDYNNSIQYNTGPQIANSAPSGVAAGNPSFLLTVNAQSPIGNPFQSATAIQWNGRKLNTTFLDGGRVTATITADMVVAPGRAIMDKLTPTGQPKALTVTSLSATQIKAVIPGIYLANADTGSVTVCNPPNIPGGGGCFSCQDQTCTNLAGGGSSTNSISFTIGGGAAAAATAAIAEETPAISQDGRYVVYGSQQNQVNQILLKDTCVGISSGCNVNTRVVSVTADGT